MADYANRLLRGLRAQGQFIDRGDGCGKYVVWKAWEPHYKTKDHRQAKGLSADFEASINWEDNPREPFEVLVGKDRQNCEHGIVIVALRDLKTIQRQNALARSSLRWERHPVKGNRYHGNILFDGKLDRAEVRELAGVISSHTRDTAVIVEPVNFDRELEKRSREEPWHRRLLSLFARLFGTRP